MNNWKLITAGIDTLDLSVYAHWPSSRFHERLALLREDAAGTDGIQPPGCNYLVLPSGKPPMYRYHLQYPEGQLYLSGDPELKHHPNVYLSLSARALWTLGAAAAVEVFVGYLHALGANIDTILPSRVDLAADLVIPGGLSFDFLQKHLVSHAHMLRPILKDDQLQTLYIGQGDLQVRLYDKSAEILASGKAFFLDVWKHKLPNIGENVRHVWRVEGQLRRPVLKALRIDSLESLYANLSGLWNFITDWASLRLPDNENSSRRTLHPLWVLVQSAAGLLGDPALALRRIASDATAPVDWYVAHILGCLVGLAARVNVALLPDALAQLARLTGGYLMPEEFTARVQAEAIRLGMGGETQPLPPP